MELVLSPGSFIASRASVSFISGLEEVEDSIARLTQSDPGHAITLYETFLAGCYEKAEELDDSSGSFAQFIAQLFCGWIEARQVAGADPDDTATRLLAWMDQDAYGFCYDLEKNATKAFDKAGLAAFEKQIRARFDAAGTTKPPPGGSPRRDPEYPRSHWGGILRTLYLAQKNLQAYVALAEETGVTAQDSDAVARMLIARGRPEDALAWVERGIDIEGKSSFGSVAGHDLAMFRRKLLTKLGRAREALEAAWTDYRDHPSKYTYDDLMQFVTRSERSLWHEKAIEAAKGADPGAAIQLFLGTKELEHLAELVGMSNDDALERVSHYTTEPAAKRLEKTRPDLAARLWRVQGMRIVNARKSRYYDAALANFERARQCFAKAGLTGEWEKTVKQVRAAHRSKTAFMVRFEEIATGSGSSEKPSFLERAKARWGRPRKDEA
jgi:tetratricopeptide (TPR) repeat protein